jgi:hypothetical protein
MPASVEDDCNFANSAMQCAVHLLYTLGYNLARTHGYIVCTQRTEHAAACANSTSMPVAVTVISKVLSAT